jgi:hypothetical protein
LVVFAVLFLVSLRADKSSAAEKAGPFDGVPLKTTDGSRKVKHPAYAGVTYMAEEVGLAMGLPAKTFSGKKVRTR